MKRLLSMAGAAMLATGASAAMAASMSLNDFTPRIMPVLVQVNAHGRVTDASPSIELTPSIQRLMLQNLDELITKPATRHGHAVSSQFVINLALKVEPRENGDYLARFAYVSSSPVPSGSWYWVKIDGHRLALASRNDFNRQERFRLDTLRTREYRSTTDSIPDIQNAVRSSSSPAATAPRGHGK
jgi:hypothetical protein